MSSIDNEKTNALEVILKEYETVRQEAMDAIGNRNQVLSFGLATIGIIFAAAISSKDILGNIRFVQIVFCGVIPVISLLVSVVWFGEVNRMNRASVYIKTQIEPRIDSIFEKGEYKRLLNWENWQRETKTQLAYPYIAATLLFILIAGSSPVAGLMAANVGICKYPQYVVIPWLITGLVGIGIMQRARKFG